MECFLDFRESGALYTIVLGCYEYKHANNWWEDATKSVHRQKNVSISRKKLDLSAQSRSETVKLFQYVQNLLRERNVLTFPICYLRPDIDKRLQMQLKQIIEKNHGTVAENEEDADHIVYPPLTESPREIEIERESKTDLTSMQIECHVDRRWNGSCGGETWQRLSIALLVLSGFVRHLGVEFRRRRIREAWWDLSRHLACRCELDSRRSGIQRMDERRRLRDRRRSGRSRQSTFIDTRLAF